MTSEYNELKEEIQQKKSNSVDHPSHYNTNNPVVEVTCTCGKHIRVPIECIDVIRYMPTWKGNAIKYLWREGLKVDSALSSLQKQAEDLKKAIWYIQDEINQIERLSK